MKDLLLQEYLEGKFDLSAFGIDRGDEESCYFCTPVGARIIGWTGVDGIHYCTVPQFGDMIFAVSPMNFGDCVHPIARDFEDFHIKKPLRARRRGILAAVIRQICYGMPKQPDRTRSDTSNRQAGT